MKVKELYTDASKWTQRTYAADANGECVSYHMDSAVCFCLAGAIHRCYPEDNEEKNTVYKKLNQRLHGLMYIDWNDEPGRTFEEVKALVEELDI